MYEFKDICGFRFVRAGDFFNSDSSFKYRYKGEDLEASLSLNLINDGLCKAEESAYLLCCGDNIMYVGEYSFNLQDRWLTRGTYVDHHKSDKVKECIANNEKVSIWITVNPYLKNNNGNNINVSKSIESAVLKKHDPVWNTRGRLKMNESWIKDNCKKISDILNIDNIDAPK